MVKSKRYLAVALILVVVAAAAAFLLIKKDSRAQKQVQMEAFALTGTEAKAFYYMPEEVQRVYIIDEEGTHEYTEGTDYVIDYDEGTIRRTEDSAIPDYAAHSCVLDDDGKFTFESEPRNPELNIRYQIYADYTTRMEGTEVAGQSSFLSQKLRDKLVAGEDIHILVLGDSISFGTNTSGEFSGTNTETTYMKWLTEYISGQYGSACDTYVAAEPDVYSSDIYAQLGEYVPEDEDLVIIEFGMNDHVKDGAMSEEGRQVFRDILANSVDQMQARGVDVILVGFFGQTQLWREEDPEATAAYNQIIADVAAEKGVYYADVQTVFEKVAEEKSLEEDLLGDYMHHPNDFGHELYYTAIVPAFVPEDCLDTDIPNYITTAQTEDNQ